MINNATTVLSVVVEDENYDINFTLQDAAGVVLDLGGATITFEAQLISDLNVEFNGAMDILSAADGTCKFTPAITDFPVAGVYTCQIVVLYSGISKKITFPNIQITAISRVPQ